MTTGIAEETLYSVYLINVTIFEVGFTFRPE